MSCSGARAARLLGAGVRKLSAGEGGVAGYDEEFVDGLSEAATDSVTLKPSASPEFAERVRELCAEL